MQDSIHEGTRNKHEIYDVFPCVPCGSIEETIKAKALELGFDLVGITTVEPSIFAEPYREWLANGYAGEMEYLARNVEKRLDPSLMMENAKSLIVVGMNYYADAEEGAGTPEIDAERGVFARYARGDDYHDVMKAKLGVLLETLKAEYEGEIEGRVFVDTAPVLEREVARRAGLGWFGKNTCLINTRRGSYFFLGEILTTAELVPDAPAVGGCGTCTRCLDACPTGALVAPFQLDARRCLSYLTIELKGAIPEEFRPALAESGNRIYGCDICQEVCPFNLRRSVPTHEEAYQSREVTDTPKLTELLVMSAEEFREKFKGSAVKRAKRRGLLRNAAVALAYSDDPEVEQELEQAANNEREPLIQEHIGWALEQINQRKQKLRLQ